MTMKREQLWTLFVFWKKIGRIMFEQNKAFAERKLVPPQAN